MGMRLIVDVYGNNEKAATISYKWSGYTTETYREIRDLVNILEDKEVERQVIENFKPFKIGTAKLQKGATKDMPLRLKLIRACEALHGKVNKSDADYARKLFPGEAFSENGSAENGIVCLSNREMSEAHKYANVIVTLDTDSRTVHTPMSAWHVIDAKGQDNLIAIPEEINRFSFPFEKAEEVCGFVLKNRYRKLTNGGDTVYEYIR